MCVCVCVCVICRTSSTSWPAIAGNTCPQSAAEKWARLAAADALPGTGDGHTIWLSDDTIWCSTCGQCATMAAVGLRRACHPIKDGTRFKRRLLASGIPPGLGHQPARARTRLARPGDASRAHGTAPRWARAAVSSGPPYAYPSAGPEPCVAGPDTPARA